MRNDVKRCVEALRTCDLPQNIQPVAFFVCRDCLAYEPDVTCRINLTAADLIESLAAELEQVEQERDAAVKEWKQSAIAGKSMCDTCMFSDDEGRCWNDCIDGELWQWRGVRNDDGKC